MGLLSPTGAVGDADTFLGASMDVGPGVTPMRVASVPHKLHPTWRGTLTAHPHSLKRNAA